ERRLLRTAERWDWSVTRGEQAVRARRCDRREHGEAERAAHHERGIHNSRGQTGVLWFDVAHGRQQERIERDAAAEAEEHHRHENIHGEAPVHGRTGEEEQAGDEETEAPDERRLEAELHYQAIGEE